MSNEGGELVQKRQIAGDAVLTMETVDGSAGLVRIAERLSTAGLVPAAFRAEVVKGFGDKARVERNPEAISNCIIAIDIANRMGLMPLMVMQNLHVIEGRPSWSAQFVIAMVNRSPRFSGGLQFDLSAPGAERLVEYVVTEWSNGAKQRVKKTAKVCDRTCVAWARDRQTGEIVRGPEVSMEMAVREGWFGKDGSKWQTMPEVMLRYRAAAFFGRIYAPEALMGMPVEGDVFDAEVVDITSQMEAPAPAPAPAPKALPAPTPAAASPATRRAAKAAPAPTPAPAPEPVVAPVAEPVAEPVVEDDVIDAPFEDNTPVVTAAEATDRLKSALKTIGRMEGNAALAERALTLVDAGEIAGLLLIEAWAAKDTKAWQENGGRGEPSQAGLAEALKLLEVTLQ